MLLLAATLTISYCPKNVSGLVFDKSNLRHHQQNQATNPRVIVSILCVELGAVCNFTGIELTF
jgi:NADPH-dependent 7-cyano-7-deazaguanine reductase QueF